MRTYDQLRQTSMYKKIENLSIKNTIFLFSGFFILAFIIFFHSVYTGSIHLSFDELYSIAMTDYSYSEIYRITAKDVHPPLFYWLLKLIRIPFDITNDTLYTYRYFTCLFYLSSLLVCAFPIRRLLGIGIASITSIILIFLPISFYTYSYVRMYALVVPLLLAVFIYIYDTYKNNTLWAWLKLFIFTLAAMYTHYYALLAAFWMFILYFILLIQSNSDKKRAQIKRYIFLGITLTLCYIPWLIELYNQILVVKNNYWINRPGFKELVFSLQYYFSPKHFEEQYSKYFSISWPLAITFLSLISTIIIFISGSILNRNKEEKKMGIFAFSSIGVTIAFILIYSYLFSPVFYVRYLSCYIGLFCIGCSITIHSLIIDGKKWHKGIIALFFICLFVLYGICLYFNEMRSKINKKEDSEKNFLIEKFMEDTNKIIYTEEILAPNLGVMSIYYPEYKYFIINDGIIPSDMLNIPDYNDPYALAPFKHLKAVSEINIDKYGVYSTGYPESISRILGDQYEVVDHLEGTILFKFKKKDKIENDSISTNPITKQ